MRFKIKVNEQHKHQELISAISWTLSNEVYT